MKQQLEMDARRVPGLRLLPGRFMVINQAMGMRRGRAGTSTARRRSSLRRRARRSGKAASSVPAGNVKSAPTLRTDSLIATVLDVPSLISPNVAFER